jgi:peptidoglycan/xylan/chitin deacetylase (PgdA/CDA1 family)
MFAQTYVSHRAPAARRPSRRPTIRQGDIVKLRTCLGALLLAGAAGHAAAVDDATAAAGKTAAGRFDIAITVDDLSAHGSLPPGMRWSGIADSYLATLKRHGVPEAYGFVNALRLKDTPDSAPVLDAWRKAGYPLGNHTYSHLGLSQAPTLQAWLDNVVQGEPAIEARMAGADWRVLRYPFLDAGNGAAGDPERHDAAQAWLRQHGYRIADVSLSFDDWAYTETYARCRAKGDEAAIAGMKRAYFARVDAAIARMKALSLAVYGRQIPEVLLTHMGAWSADTLPEVMAKLDAAGARYVTLAQAQSDAAYREAGPQSANGTLPERAAMEKHVDVRSLPQVPPPGPLDAMCR